MINYEELDDLSKLAIAYKTDKSPQGHNYTPFYDSFLKDNRDSYTNVLEIGVWHNGSIMMWHDYFKNARIHGIDVLFKDMIHVNFRDRVKFYYCDQGNANDLGHVLAHNEFDMIVDDGSHKQSHQMTSLFQLFPMLKDGGYYIIEDIYNGKLWDQGYGVPVKDSLVGTTINLLNLIGDDQPINPNNFDFDTSQNWSKKDAIDYLLKWVSEIKLYEGNMIFGTDHEGNDIRSMTAVIKKKGE